MGNLLRPSFLVTTLCMAAVVFAGCDSCKGGKGKPPSTEPAAVVESPLAIKPQFITPERRQTVFSKPPELPVQKELVLDEPGKGKGKVFGYAPDETARELTVTANIRSRELRDGAWSERVVLPEIRYGLGIRRSGGEEDAPVLDLRGLVAEAGKVEHKDPRMAKIIQRLVDEFLDHYRKHVERRRATMVMSKRGVPGKLELSPDAAESTSAAQIRQALVQLLLESVVPLPDKAIAPGARWHAVTLLYRGPGVVTQRAEYELVAVEKDQLRIKVSVTQIGERQTVPVPDLPASMMAELVGLFWKVTGEVVVTPASVTPVSGTLDVEFRVHSRLIKPGGYAEHFVESVGTVALASK